ncbi:MAG TPA: glycosyltransferase [Rhodanobacteraceae bacterium]
MADRMLKIAIVTPMLPIPHDQTRGRYIHETARSLARIADVRVFFAQLGYLPIPGLKPRSFLTGTVGEAFRLPDIDVEAFTYTAIPVASRALNAFVESRGLIPRLRRFSPDVAIGYWIYPDGDATVRAARALGIPAVVGALGSDIHVRSGMTARQTRRAIAASDALIVVSDAMRRTAIRDFGAAPPKVHTITNGFNASIFRPQSKDAARRELGIDAQSKLVIYIGRLIESKGLRELIEAARKVAETDANFRLALVGDGVMREELVRLVSDSGLAERTLIPGGMAPAEVARWIAAADVLTLPSWSEGYPNVVVEALACGRPVVATDVGGTAEIVNETNGLLIPPHDPEALAKALARALETRWDSNAIAAQVRRSWDDVARETLRVCEDIVAAAASRGCAAQGSA